MDELVNSVWFTFFAGLASIIGLFIPLYQTRIRYLSSSILKNREMLKIFLISIGFGLIIISLIEINKQEYPPSRTYKTIYRLLHTSQTSPAWQEGVYTFSIPQINYIKKMNVEIDSFIISNRFTEIFYRAEVTNERKQGYLIKHSNISKNDTKISEFSKRKRAAELGLGERTPKRITIEVVDPFEPNYTYLLEDPFATPILGSYHLIDKDTILLDNYLFLGRLKFPSIKGIQSNIKCWPNKISDNQSEYFLFENEKQEKYENKIWGLMLYFGLGFSFLGILWNVQKQIIKNLGKQINKNNTELKEELDKILKNRLYSELFLNEKEIYDKTCSYYNRINSELITIMIGNNTNLVLGNNIEEKDHTT